MIKLLILAFAYLLCMPIADIDVVHYYYFHSIAYSVIALACYYVYTKTRDLMILLYMLVNYLYSILHLAVNFGESYYLLRGVIWHNTINMSLVLTSVELMLLLSGISSAAIFIISLYFTDSVKHKSNAGGGGNIE